MMSTALAYSFISVLAVSLVSFVGVFTLVMTGSLLRRAVFVLVSLSVGVLFGDVFVHLLPELYESVPGSPLPSLFVIGGIVLFFVLEKFFRWGHAHEGHGHAIERVFGSGGKSPALGRMVLFADGLHNFIDGAIITASFMAGTEIGIATLTAVVLHEIPQEIGDFGILIHAGYSKGKALLFNFFSGLASFLGLLFAYALGGAVENFTYIMLAFAAGGFIYIAGSDLVPELQKASSVTKSLAQLAAILAGFMIMFALLAFE